VRNAHASSLDRVVLVVGGAADGALAGLPDSRAEVAYNEAYGEGCASSLLAGLDAAGDPDAAMLLLGDMPGVDASIIDAVRSGWEARRPWGLLTSYDGGVGHPFVFSAAAFPSLRELHGDKAVWKLVDRMERLRLERPRPRDVDTWEDYEALLRTG
jgi:molybdenum cofactor cytidylyltransferase